MTVDELLILTEDAIEYDALDVSLLGELARQPIESFIATTALAKLHGRDELRAQAVCVGILARGDDADRHLQAFAMTMLYSTDWELAIAEMERLAREDCHASLVGAMIENVMSDRERFESAHELVARLRPMCRSRAVNGFWPPERSRRLSRGAHLNDIGIGSSPAASSSSRCARSRLRANEHTDGWSVRMKFGDVMHSPTARPWALLLPFAFAMACGERPRPSATSLPPPTKPLEAATIDAGVVVPDSALPVGFPQVGASALPGVVKAIFARDHLGGAHLRLYSWAEGSVCASQFARSAGQRLVDVVMGPGVTVLPGTLVTSRDRFVMVSYEDSAKRDLSVIFDTIEDHQITGRLLMTSSAGSVSGSFIAVNCSTVQKVAAELSEVHGLKWGARDIAPDSLPHASVETRWLGKKGAPVFVEWFDYPKAKSMPELNFVLDPKRKPCEPERLKPGFTIAPNREMKAGLKIQQLVTDVSPRDTPVAVVYWAERDDSIGMLGDGYVSIMIDTVTSKHVTGRVFAWFDDPSKSMVVGAFAAMRCRL